jgi:hypothetical protein
MMAVTMALNQPSHRGTARSRKPATATANTASPSVSMQRREAPRLWLGWGSSALGR